MCRCLQHRWFFLCCSDCAQRLEADYKAVTDKEKAEVVQLGGLHVVGTERHVSLENPFISNSPHSLTYCQRRIPARHD